MRNDANPREDFTYRLAGAALPILAGLTLIRLVVAWATPLSADEAYYWLWSRPPQLSYFDHPGMVAWMIWGSTQILGDTTLGIRLPAIIVSVIVSLLIWDAADIAFDRRRVGAMAALWLNATLLFGSGAIIMTPDVPLLLFWSLALWALLRLIDSGTPGYLYLAGISLGLGVLAKYTIALFLPGALLALVLMPQLRRWLFTRHLWISAVLALLCTAPLFIWNAGNHWVSISKQFNHAFAAPVANPLKNFSEFVGGEFGVITPLILPIILWAAGWALWEGWRREKPAWFLMGLLSLPPLAFFTFHSLNNVVQPHWPGPAYLSALVAVGGWYFAGYRPDWIRRWVGLAPLLGLIVVLFVYVQAATAMIPIPARIDPLKRLGGWDELAAAVTAERAAHPDSFLFAPEHEVTGILSFWLPDHPPVFQGGPGPKPSNYTAQQVLALKGKGAILVTRTRDDDSVAYRPFFASLDKIREVEMHWGGRPAEGYTLYFGEDYKGGGIPIGTGIPAEKDAP